jgi:tetratricopeptide (TPR) repeat protein
MARAARIGPLVTLLALSLLPATGAAQVSPADSARRLAERGRRTDALAYGEAAARAAPANPLALAALATGALAVERFDQAVAAADSAVALAPGLSAAQLILGQAYLSHARAHPSLGAIRKVKTGRAALERAIALDPDNLDARHTLLQFLLQAPGFVGGSRQEAGRQAEEVARRDRTRGLLARIEVAEAGRSTAAVEELFDQAIALIGTPADSAGTLRDGLLAAAGRLRNGNLREGLTRRIRAHAGRVDVSGPGGPPGP